MRVKVRNGYGIRVAGVDRKANEVFECSEGDYQKFHWVFDIVPEEKPVEEVKLDPDPVEVKAAVMTEVEVKNRVIESPMLKRGKRKL